MSCRSRSRAIASTVDASTINEFIAPYELVKTMRASILVLGPLLGRFGHADVSLPGGCAIGARPVNLHVAGLRAMGAAITIDGGYIRARARASARRTLVLDTVTVTGTENLMMAAVCARGEIGASRTPRASRRSSSSRHFLNDDGREDRGRRLRHDPHPRRRAAHGTDYDVMPDRIESGTYLVAAAITGGRVKLTRTRPEHLDAVLQKLAEAGARIARGADSIELDMQGRRPPRRRHQAPRRTPASRRTCRRSSAR